MLPVSSLSALQLAFAAEGLHIVRPVSQNALDHAGVAVALDALLPGGRAGLVIADGGGDFFARTPARDHDPLDHHTTETVTRLLGAVFGPHEFAVRFPFLEQAGEGPLPIQRIARAAGLPPPGPLGLQIHPTYGPWWAYRAFAVVRVPFDTEQALAAPCDGCPAPCVPACLGAAVHLDGLDARACMTHRLRDPACGPSCAARLACPVGSAHRYPGPQLAYHMNASLVWLRRHAAG